MSTSEPTAHDASAPSSTAPAQAGPWSFKRIRLATSEDLRVAYALLSEYIQHPERADCVEEFIVDLRCSSCPWLNEPPVPSASVTFDERTHALLVQFAKNLGLPQDTANAIVRALELKERELKGEAPDEPEPPAKRARFLWIDPRGYIPDYDCTVAMLLIALCPNIRTLRFYNVSSETPLGQFLLLNNYGQLPKPVLQKLKHVHLHPVNLEDERFYDYIRTLDDFRYVHRLPAVQSFSMEGFEDYQPDEIDFPRKTSGITKINIGHSDMSGEMIGCIMLIPKQLREFSLSLYGLLNTDGGTSMIDRKTIAKALLEHRHCLQVLDLDATVSGPGYPGEGDGEPLSDSSDEDEASDPQADESAIATREWCLQQDKKDSSHGRLWADEPANRREYPHYSIGRLHEFTALTHLSIRIGLILGYHDTGHWGENETSATYRLIDALPPNLEFLRLYGYRKGERPEVDDQVQELRDKRTERFPKLAEIQGVDEHLPGVPGTYDGDGLAEDDVWVRPTEGLDWAAV